MRRRFAALAATLMVLLVYPAAALAQAASSETVDKPTGHDGTLTTIFFIALGIPVVLTVLTLIDIAVGRGKHDNH